MILDHITEEMILQIPVFSLDPFNHNKQILEHLRDYRAPIVFVDLETNEEQIIPKGYVLSNGFLEILSVIDYCRRTEQPYHEYALFKNIVFGFIDFPIITFRKLKELEKETTHIKPKLFQVRTFKDLLGEKILTNIELNVLNGTSSLINQSREL